MNIDDKKLFIYKNIDKISNHNEIIYYIQQNDIKFTTNSNGFFVNISCMNDDNINNIYNILSYYINNINENDIFEDKREKLLESLSKNLKDKNIYNIPLSEFSDFEQGIIKHSKQFKI